MIELTLDHGGVSVADLDVSRTFYTQVLGFTLEEEFRIPNTPIRGAVLINATGSRVELFCREGSEVGLPGHPTESTKQQGWFQLAFRVADLKATFDEVVAGGATAVKLPFTAPDGRSQVAFIGDPDGNLIELIQRS